MPHFIIECPSGVIAWTRTDKLLDAIRETAGATGLFNAGDIKVRINMYEHYCVADKRADFIHVFAHIMEGRTPEQKADLSQRMVLKLKEMFPKVQVISMNVYEFERASYCNLPMLGQG